MTIAALKNKPHVPTLIYAVTVAGLVFALYAFTLGRKRRS